MRIELGSDLLGCRQVVPRSIEGDDRHAVPDIGGVARKEAVGKLDRFLKDVLKEGPGDFLASMGECATVDLLGIGPQSASPGRSKEITGFNVHSLALPAGNQREDEGVELGEGEFTASSEVRVRSLGIRGGRFGDEVKKICKDSAELACIFMAGSVP